MTNATSVPKKHFAAAIFWRIEEGELEVLTMLCRQHEAGRPPIDQVKFPGGTDKSADEDPNSTLAREVLEETGVALAHAWPACQIPKNPAPGQHFQKYYLVGPGEYNGDFRLVAIWDGTQEELLPPGWKKVRLLRGVMYRNHAVALREALEYMRDNRGFRSQYPEVSEAAAQLLS